MIKESHLIVIVWTFLAVPLLAQNIFISEFMAKNGTNFVDEDGDSSDWIELYNASANPVNLTGWTLTDDATDPAQWTFPTVMIQPQEHLVVFASNKDRATTGAELHTNFKLSGGGEYLGLLRPDSTIASEFAPTYPPQEDDIPYGFQTQSSGSTTLIQSSAPAKAFVPTDGSLGLTWTGSGFNDAGWISGTTSIGYERFGGGYNSILGLDLGSSMYGNTASAYARIPFTVTNLTDLVSLSLNMKYDDGFIAYLNGTQIANRRAPASPAWNSAATSENPDSAAFAGEDVQLAAPNTLLTSGANVLAVHLLNRNTTSSDLICLPELTAGTADYTANIVFLDTATPGSPNSSGAVGSVDDTSFTVDRGFYTAPFTTVITCPTPGATIIYTTDGSNPDFTNGTAVPAGSATVPPIASVNISFTTVLRAAAFLPGFSPSNIDTMTYIFLADVIQQDIAATLARGFPITWDGFPSDYGMDPDVIGPGDLFTNKYAATIISDLQTIPTISISLPLDDLFGTAGIYSHPTARGSDWERACSVEWLDPNSVEEFQVNCGIIHCIN